MRPKSQLIELVPDHRVSNSVSLNDPRKSVTMDKNNRKSSGKRVSNKEESHEDERPLSVFMGPSMAANETQQMMEQSSGRRRASSSPTSSVVSSNVSLPKQTVNRKSSAATMSTGSTNNKPAAINASPSVKSPLASNSNNHAPTPKSMTEAMAQFEQAKRNANQRFKHNMSSTQRLISALADLTVVLLTRAMNEGADNRVELRVFKKPASAGNGNYAVAEYRNIAHEIERPNASEKKGPTGEQTSDNEYSIVLAGDLIAGEEGSMRDNVENWRSFFGVVKSVGLWWRYCLAVHKRIGWRVKLDRSLLNVIDGRVLGYVTINISNFV